MSEVCRADDGAPVLLFGNSHQQLGPLHGVQGFENETSCVGPGGSLLPAVLSKAEPRLAVCVYIAAEKENNEGKSGVLITVFCFLFHLYVYTWILCRSLKPKPKLKLELE